MSYGSWGGCVANVLSALKFAVLISFSPAECRDDFKRNSGNDSFFYFLSHITSFVLLIVSWWETQKLLLQWQSGNCLNKCFWRGTRKQSQLFFYREAESLPRKVTTEKTDSKEIFLRMFFKRNKTDPFLKTKINSWIQGISELSDGSRSCFLNTVGSSVITW